MAEKFYTRLWNDLIELEGKVKAGALSADDQKGVKALLERASLFFTNHGIDPRNLLVPSVLRKAILECDRERAIEAKQEEAAKEHEKYR